jgi:putative ABC transport system permease protein
VTYVPLSISDLIPAAALILLHGGLSFYLKLGIHRPLLLSAVRMTIQLMLVGYALTFLLAAASPLWSALAVCVMFLFAGREIAGRQSRPFEGGRTFRIGTVCAFLAAGSLTLLALIALIQPDPWHDPRFALLLLGMVLGNTMTGISLGLDVLTDRAFRDAALIEAQLALGATRWQALLPITRSALRSGLMPTINAMAAIGVVSLPGMMTGQILAGVAPTEAVKYQLLVMFLIAGATALGTGTAVAWAVFSLTDERDRLRLDRLRQR